MYLLHRKKIDIYANISLFLSYSEVTVATRSGPYPAHDHCSQQIQSVTRSDGGSAPRDDLYSSERQRRPGHLEAPETDPQWGPRHLDAIGEWPLELVEPLHSDFAAVGTNYWFVWPKGTAPPPPPPPPQTEPGFSQGFFLCSVTDGVLVPCRCCLWLS